jgi:hypothetical protein
MLPEEELALKDKVDVPSALDQIAALPLRYDVC